MYNIETIFNFKYNNPVSKKNIIQGDKYRITIINQRLIRFEYQELGMFTDEPTQVVLTRNFGEQQYKLAETENELEIETEYLIISYNKQQFSSSGLQITQKKALDQDTIWRYGQKDKRNLKGTTRTLDDIDGRIQLEDGIISRNGYGIIDDSTSLILNQDGSLKERNETIDLYYLGYGNEYRKALKDFYKLTGNYPKIPEYMLGNWWSRFWEYDEKSVKELVNKFEKYKIPLSVFIFDMDWHLVDIEAKYGSGWTGFSWNKKLFSDPKRIIEWLHKKNIKMALNLHPSDGFRAFESDYHLIANDLNHEVSSEKPIVFDVTNEKFMNSYFKHFIEPNEVIGVDFWWLDWQQGDTSKIKNLDPLWMLNHCHYLHHAKNHDIPAIFSRFAKVGSHRYPIGFSGDTHVTWESLAFQPEFTATSANVGYNYWSHDIGGHMLGSWDEELYRRWLQYGVFSPIMRLHSGKTLFIDKEPWENSEITLKVAQMYLQLRHKLMAFINSENIKGSKAGHQLIEPLYYDYPEDEQVYQFKNQYLFAKQLLIAPVVTPKCPQTNLAKTVVYLPQGEWYDVHGRMFNGNQTYNYYTDEFNYPVFQKTGAIIPLVVDKELELNLVCGNGQYEFVTEIASYQIKQVQRENKLLVSYPKSLADNYNITIKFNKSFAPEYLETKNEKGQVTIHYKIMKQENTITKQELIKIIKNFKLTTYEKNKIENNQYILNENASSKSRIFALNSIDFTSEQKELLISLLML